MGQRFQPGLIRIVRMDFKPELVEEFLAYFDTIYLIVAGQEGCTDLKLCQDINHTNVFFTVSHWDGEDYLEKYRNSETFATIWTKTKSLFANKALAYSLSAFDFGNGKNE